ncbi:MAG: hypothetical protein LQ349_007656, partial [Xanthoria aureola]
LKCRAHARAQANARPIIDALESTTVATTASIHTSMTGARFGKFPSSAMKQCQSSSSHQPQFVRKIGFANTSNARRIFPRVDALFRLLCEGNRPAKPKLHVKANI